MAATFYCLGTTPADMDLLSSVASAANAGAPTLRSQVGIASRPVAVGLSESSLTNTSNSEIRQQDP